MKAWWKIGDKPRGRWRPLLEGGLSFSSDEQSELEELNVKNSVKFCLRGGFEKLRTPPGIIPGRQICTCRYDFVWVLAEHPYEVDYKQESDRKDHGLIGYKGFCKNCTLDEGWYDRKEYNSPFQTIVCFRLPWRPGARPDYADFIDPAREFLRQVLEMMEGRLAEARESASSDEWMLEEEFDSFSWHTENDVEVGERKLRVIRR